MTIHLPKDLERFVHDAVRGGRYAREDDVIRDALIRLRQAMPDEAARSVFAGTILVGPPSGWTLRWARYPPGAFEVNLAAGQADGAAERGARVESEAVRDFALRVDGNFVAYGLQILIEFGGLWCWLHAFLGDEVVG